MVNCTRLHNAASAASHARLSWQLCEDYGRRRLVQGRPLSELPLAAEVLGWMRAMVAGCVAGSIGQLVGFPLDTLKVRTQLQATREMALFSGWRVPVATAGAINCANFGVYDSAWRSLSDVDDDVDAPSSVVFAAGACGGFTLGLARGGRRVVSSSGRLPTHDAATASTARRRFAGGSAGALQSGISSSDESSDMAAGWLQVAA